MTSLQIAEVAGKQHKDVMRSIRNMESAWEKVNGRRFALVEYLDAKGESRPCYSLTKTECLYIATKFNDEARAKLVLRWQELEEEQRRRQQPQIPTTYLAALRSLIESEEQRTALAQQNYEQRQQIESVTNENLKLGNVITEMRPKADYYDRILASRGTCTITQIAQDYGMSAKAMNKMLNSLHVQHKVGDQWILYTEYLSMGYVHSKAVQIIRANGAEDTKYNTEWTTKGRIFLYNILKKNGIIPIIERPVVGKGQTE